VHHVVLERYVQNEFKNSAEWKQVSSISDQLLTHLNTPPVRERITAANQPGQSSVNVQEAFLGVANELGFESEKKGLFAGENLILRPDYYLKLETCGIVLEVERGKTTINNMDLLDFWKCHLCSQADYLFLLVPLALRQNANMLPRNEFTIVKRRLSQFFRPQNYTNVRALCLYGY